VIYRDLVATTTFRENQILPAFRTITGDAKKLAEKILECRGEIKARAVGRNLPGTRFSRRAPRSFGVR
jgi:hypothetical protein